MRILNLSLHLWLTATLGITSLTLAHAQSEPDVDGGQKPLWEAGVAGFGLTGPAYPGADDDVSRALVLPWLIYRGPIWRAADGTFGARVVNNPFAEFDVGLGGALRASSDDVKVRDGMPDLGFLLEFGPRVKLNLMWWWAKAKPS